MEPTITTVLTPVVQYGFAGFCVLQFGVIVWLTRQFLDVLRQNNLVIAGLTEIIRATDAHTVETREVLYSLRDKMLSLRCLSEKG